MTPLSAAQLRDLNALAAALRNDPASAPFLGRIDAGEIEPMREKGVAHAHFRLRGRGLVLRIPRLSQWALPPSENLAYQAACFARAAPSGATPRLVAVIPVGPSLPRGALLVEEIVGRPPLLPAETPAIAASLARLHDLAVPPEPERPPLADHESVGAVAGTLAVIERQAPAIDRAALPAETRAALLEELAWARRFAAESKGKDQPIRLVGTDTHPGNFLIRVDGSAILVDLEKALYGAPAIDLAHASLPTSTLWDSDVQVVLSRAEIEAFYRHYLGEVGETAAAQSRPWLAPCRRLTWLRTMTWFVRWTIESSIGAEWSAAAVDPALVAHIRHSIARALEPETVAAARAEWLGAEPLRF